MPGQRRRWAGRQTTSIDRDYIDLDDLRAICEAERQQEAHARAEFKASVDAVNERNRRLYPGEPVNETPTDPYWQGGL